jgi:hypothetical protein
MDTIQLDLNSGSFTYLVPGGRPVRCAKTGLLAVISSNDRSIEVRDFAGAIRRRFRYRFRRSIFRNIVQWIDDRRLLYTSAVGFYRDTLGIADVETDAMREYALSSRGEISGACCQSDPAA